MYRNEELKVDILQAKINTTESHPISRLTGINDVFIGLIHNYQSRANLSGSEKSIFFWPDNLFLEKTIEICRDFVPQ
jgi:hypothetical protein